MNERITDDMVEAASKAIRETGQLDAYFPKAAFPWDSGFMLCITRAALAAALQHQSSLPVEAWQTLETAPKDGTHVLLFTQWGGDEIATDPFDEIQIGYWDAGNLTGDIWHREPGWSCERIGEATYWRHLPAAPSTGGR